VVILQQKRMFLSVAYAEFHKGEGFTFCQQ